MADYTWRQWEAEQNDANLLHASDCERWQAGIELAGGSWDGEWTDLDTSGKGLITIDQFNALESQIQSKVSSYTPKNYDPDSTAQIVPGPDGWNKVEDGILKAVCEPDGVNRNWLLASREFPNSRTGVSGYSTSFVTRTVDEDGFGVMTRNLNNSASQGTLYTTVLATDDQWAGKQMVFSLDVKCNVLSSIMNTTTRMRLQIFGTNNFTSYTNKLQYLWTFGNYILNPDDVKDGEWCRLNMGFTCPPMSEMTVQTETEFSDYIYAFGVQLQANTIDEDFSFRKTKLELADSGTAWVDNPEDYGGSGDSNTLTATPQSVEDSDEIPAVEAGEIE